MIHRFELPWPPSVNHYWLNRRGGGRRISDEGVAFRAAVVAMRDLPRLGKARVDIKIVAYPPDKRRRDLDNILKPTLDALTHALVYNDDCQIDDLRIMRGEEMRGGLLEVSIVALTTDH